MCPLYLLGRLSSSLLAPVAAASATLVFFAWNHCWRDAGGWLDLTVVGALFSAGLTCRG
ncbi:hypothetical protein LZ32DRAFT_608738 [Colletotrichum eremochloae]|nr:hypothetical protein LZ32DRAFT_608738 [Colletotrichum eremochloae]